MFDKIRCCPVTRSTDLLEDMWNIADNRLDGAVGHGYQILEHWKIVEIMGLVTRQQQRQQLHITNLERLTNVKEIWPGLKLQYA